MNTGMKPRASPSSPTSWLLRIFYVWVVASVASLQVATAVENPNDGTLTANDHHQVENDLMGDFEDDEGQEVDYEEDIEDIEHDLAWEDGYESDEITAEDIQDIMEARKALEALKTEHGEKSLSFVPSGTITTLNVNDPPYAIRSHADFGVYRYPNREVRRWWFYKSPDVYCIVVYCPFFRIQWSRRCRYDKFAIFRAPFKRGIRRCGQIHGFYKRYYVSIKIIFKTNYIVRRAGFVCTVRPIPFPKTTTTTTSTTTTTTFAPGCRNAPVAPPERIFVETCADISPAFPYCTCEDIPHGICLHCEICTACDMQFFADHDFSLTYVYLYLEFTCPLYPFNAAALVFGLENYVLGVVICLPEPLHVTLPIYHNSSTVIISFCPVNPAYLVVCVYFATNGGRRSLPVRDHSLSPVRSNSIEGRTLISLAHIPESTDRLLIVGFSVDMLTLSHPQNIKVLNLDGTATCDTFPDTTNIDLRNFTNLETLYLTLCDNSLGSNSIKLNSAVIELVDLDLPYAASPDVSLDCLDNAASTPDGYPSLVISTD